MCAFVKHVLDRADSTGAGPVQDQELGLMILVSAFQLQDITCFYDPNPNQHLDDTTENILS